VFCLPTLILLLSVSAADPEAQGEPDSPPTQFRANVTDPLLAPYPRAEQELATFQQAMDLLRKASTDAHIAEASVEAAAGRSRQALAVLLPNLELNASVTTDLLNDDRPTAPAGFANIQLFQSVLDVSAWRGVSAASAAQSGAEARYKDVQRRLVQGLSRTLIAVVAAERIAELNRLALQQALERAALTNRTQELGAAARIDVVRVEQDVEVARGNLIAGDEQLKRTRESLGVLLGFGREVGVAGTFVLDTVFSGTGRECRPLEWDQRADLVAARADVEGAEASRGQASAGYLPAIGLQSRLDAETVDPGFGHFNAWSVSAVLSVPIWEGGARGGLIRERSAQVTQAEQALEATRRAIEIEVAQARRGVSFADALVKTASAARAKAAELDQLTRRSFEVGRGSSLELVQSAVALRQADVALITRELDLVQARLDAFLTEASCDW
jgi:outer membrane protein TolC